MASSHWGMYSRLPTLRVLTLRLRDVQFWLPIRNDGSWGRGIRTLRIPFLVNSFHRRISRHGFLTKHQFFGRVIFGGSYTSQDFMTITQIPYSARIINCELKRFCAVFPQILAQSSDGKDLTQAVRQKPKSHCRRCLFCSSASLLALGSEETESSLSAITLQRRFEARSPKFHEVVL